MTLTLGGVVIKRKKNHTKARTLTRLEVETPLGVVEDENYSRCPTRFLSAMVLLLRSKQGLNVRSIQKEKEEEGGGGGGAMWSIPMCCSRLEDLTEQAPASRKDASLK